MTTNSEQFGPKSYEQGLDTKSQIVQRNKVTSIKFEGSNRDFQTTTQETYHGQPMEKTESFKDTNYKTNLGY